MSLAMSFRLKELRLVVKNVLEISKIGIYFLLFLISYLAAVRPPIFNYILMHEFLLSLTYHFALRKQDLENSIVPVALPRN